MGFSKSFLIITNVILFIVGAAVIGIASCCLSKVLNDDYKEWIEEPLLYVIIVVLIVGILAIIFGFLGILGVVRESKGILYTSAVIMLVLFLAMVASAIYLLIPRAALESSMKKKFRSESNWESVQAMQVKKRCCGVKGREEYADLEESCQCELGGNNSTNANCVEDKDGDGFHYKRGCAEALFEPHKKWIIYLAVAAPVMAIFMFLSMISAFGQAKSSNYE